MRTIYSKKEYRIVELEDFLVDIEFLKGDCFRPEINPDIELDELIEQERAFERKIESDGVFGYALERWNPEIGIGWEHVDSCFGFVGRHETEEHYIVQEFIEQIEGA